MDLLIRSASNDDFDSIYPLFQQLWPNKEIDRTNIKRVFARGIASPADELLCAVLDGAVIGFCAYAIVNCLWQEGTISYIYAMVVHQDHRGKGYGTQLLQAAIDTSRQQGMKRVELDSGFPREQAHRFYEKFGFEKRAFLFSYRL